MKEPAWIEHDGSAVCPVPAGHDVEVRFRDRRSNRDDTPESYEWSHIGSFTDLVSYRDWTAFAKEQEAMGKDDVPNPPAFPSHAGDPEMSDPRNQISCGGMSLRDYIATAALQGIGTWMPDNFSMGMNSQEALDARARWAYQQSDAMLRARIPNIDSLASAAGGGEE